MTSLNRMLLRDLAHMRGQAIAIGLVIACGVASYVSQRSMYRSLLLAQSDYYDTYRFADIFAHLKRAPDDVRGSIANIPGVAAVQARVVQEVVLDVPGLLEPATGRLISIPARRAPQNEPMLNDLFLRSGTYPAVDRDDEVLSSEAFAEANKLKLGDHIAAVMNGRWKQLRITGIALSPEYIYAVRPGAIFPDNRRFGILWMNEKAMAPAFDMDGAFNDVALRVSRGASEQDVMAQLDRIIGEYGGMGSYGREEQVSNRFISDEIQQNQVSSRTTPTIFLFIAALLLQISLTRLVGIQRSQIALLKSLGYSNRTVGLHYLKLALLLVCGGVLLGIGVGLYAGTYFTTIYQEFYRFPRLTYQPTAGVLASAVIITMTAAALGALDAVRRAIRMPPAEAMKPAPPAAFHEGLIERLHLQKVVSLSGRMIWRNVTRHPARTALSVFAIACATAVLLIGWFFYDSFDHLFRIQFDTLEREDLSVVLNAPRDSSATYAIGRLPGVLRVEPYRDVPVRLRHGFRSRRAAITGLAPGSSLRRLVDVDEHPVALPDDGLVLSRKLAEKLGASAGDAITVEVLEGERPVREARLAAVVDEPLGLGAYMNLEALNRFMREGNTITGAQLQIDALWQPRLYQMLKQTPLVSGVGVRKTAMTSLREILASSFELATDILVVFASIIAVGAIYNGLRIALSERSTELASLRVLGFTRAEIRGILLGEQTLITLAGIPCGWLLGTATCALLSRLLETDLYRMPFVISQATYARSGLVVLAAAGVSAVLVARRLRQLDLLAVLKARE
jgi:putative ABC transport system permease protein